MVALLGPVDAVAQGRRPVVLRRWEGDAETGEQLATARRQPVGDIAAGCREAVLARHMHVVQPVAADDGATLDERREDRYAQLSREVVVARSCAPQEREAVALLQRPHLRRRRQSRQGLDHARDLCVPKLEIAMATLRMHGHEPSVDELAEMLRRRRGGDPGLGREERCGQRAAVHEREQDPRARAVGEQGGELFHGSSVPPGRFGPGRNDYEKARSAAVRSSSASAARLTAFTTARSDAVTIDGCTATPHTTSPSTSPSMYAAAVASSPSPSACSL